MKSISLATALLLPIAAMAAANNVLEDSTDYAKVLNVTPLAGQPVARQVCDPASYGPPAEHNGAGAVVGGLTGALLGSRFGGGHGRNAATVVGAIGGAMVGDRIASADGVVRQQCNTVYEPGPPAGYQVTYDYHGRLSTITLNHPPGDYLRVHKRVTVE